MKKHPIKKYPAQKETIGSCMKVIRNGQVTLPKILRDSLRIQEGDILEAVLVDNFIVLKPKILIDKKSRLSPRGERKVIEALKDYKAGRVKKFENIEDLIEDLNS